MIKPHGSCNFLTRDTGMRPAPYLVTGTVVEAGIEAQGPDRTLPMVTALRAEPISARTRWPVMSNYASNKSTPLSSGQVFQVRIGFSERVKHAAKIIVIGARPNDHDHHIWAPMRACTAEVLYVGVTMGTKEPAAPPPHIRAALSA